MNYFPFFYRLTGKPCLVVGGGRVALRRAKTLIAYGAKVTVIAVKITPELKQCCEVSGGECFVQPVDVTELSRDYFCIVTATDKRDVNQAVADFAREHAIPVNIADKSDECDFIFPSIIERDVLSISISNGGASPVFSRMLNRQLDAWIPQNYGALPQLAGKYRDQIKASNLSGEMRKQFWEHVFTGDVADAVYSGDVEHAESLLLQALDKPKAYSQQGSICLLDGDLPQVDLFSVRAFRRLLNASIVVYPSGISDEILPVLDQSIQTICADEFEGIHALEKHVIEYVGKGQRVAVLCRAESLMFDERCDEVQEWISHGGKLLNYLGSK